MAVADFNGDGKMDVLEQTPGTLLVLLGNGDGTFQPAISSASGADLFPLTALDLNGDGKADVVGVFNNALVVYVGKGDGTFAPGVSYTLGVVRSEYRRCCEAIFSGYFVQIQLGNGDGSFQAPIPSIPCNGALAAVDLNEDGELDLLFDNSEITQVYLGNGDGTVSNASSYPRNKFFSVANKGPST